ncbi:MAG: hypothetical protein DI530_02870 [Sphingomonas sp.]|uniref:Uncharacterized protein n=3 Tax=Sphingomonadaceae TaxID=41297 RepID=A0A2A4I788_9SPHN|nr:hypothetical protein COA07_09920 [Sphingomonas adhaesiva]PZU81167.1 MAG: hypothetical protein DI530_02870 [Sphingomonas sp.]
MAGRDATGGLIPLQRRPRRGRGGLAQRVAFIAAANLIILIAAGIVGGVVMPLGMFGALAVMMLMAAVTLAIAFAPAPATPVPTPERIARSELKALPMQTARWLDAQRPALPAPAVTVLDRLDQRLDTLGVQLAALDEDSPAAADVRRLVGEQLPDFVRDYQRVPAPLRGTSRNGRTPDQQLIDGLSVIEREIGEMSTQLAQGDLDTLETRSRFLEIKYQGE